MGSNHSCPWPGPIPYSENEQDIFFGREKECRELEARLLDQKLTVLVARSGAGKTSLLRAGLFPRLFSSEGNGSGFGVVFLIRNWTRVGRVPPFQLILDELLSSIDRSEEFEAAPRENQHRPELWNYLRYLVKEFRSGASSNVDVVRLLRRICDDVGPVALLVDQFEELLGSGLESRSTVTERETTDLFSEIYLRAPGVRVLLSMRIDYVAYLAGLGLVVEDLDRRRVLLEPMTSKVGLDALTKAASARGVEIATKILNLVASWITEKKVSKEDAWEHLELIKLQAILKEICEFAKERRAEPERILIDLPLLEEFRAEFPHTPREDLADAALQRHIARSFGMGTASNQPGHPGSSLIRRLAAQMAPWLTTAGGFKRPMRESELLFHAIRQDIENLANCRVKEDRLQKWIAGIRGGKRPALPRTLREAIAGMNSNHLSGDAVAWDIKSALETIVLAAVTAIEDLARQDRNVLKITPSVDGQSRDVELVHDAFGPALRQFADEEQTNHHFHLASLAPLRGLPLWHGLRLAADGKDPFPSLVEGYKWLGCDLFGVELIGIHFRRCVLSGSIFRDCTLENCTFEDCDLKGTVFLGGRWRQVSWKDCDAQSLLLSGASGRPGLGSALVWEGGNWAGCNLDGATISNVEVADGVRISDSSLRFAQVQPRVLPNLSLTIAHCELYNSLIHGDAIKIDRRSCRGEPVHKMFERKYPSRLREMD